MLFSKKVRRLFSLGQLVSCTAWAASASSAGQLSRNIDALLSTHELPGLVFIIFGYDGFYCLFNRGCTI